MEHRTSGLSSAAGAPDDIMGPRAARVPAARRNAVSVITISRGSFSGGKALAKCLAESLGFRCVDRDVIVERAAARGVSQEELMDALLKPPTLIERLQHRKYVYLALIQAALAEEVRTGKVVYHGNAGHLLLKGGAHVLRVRIIAPLEFRVALIEERLKYSRPEALAYIEKTDQDRKKWTHYLYGVDWGDPVLYDVVLNLEQISISQACEIVAAMAGQRCFEFTPECQMCMDDLALASRIRADIAINPSTAHLEVQVESRKGIVRIRGKLSAPSDLEEIRRIALSAPRLAELDLAGLGVP
jgi:cytidylate kinase